MDFLHDFILCSFGVALGILACPMLINFLAKPARSRRLIGLAWRWKRQARLCQAEIVMAHIDGNRWKGASIFLGQENARLCRQNELLVKALKEAEDRNADLRKKVLPDGL